MKPPSIGEALGKGFEAFKANAVPLIIGTCIGLVLGMIPGMGFAGMFNMALKAVRGQKPEIGDVFCGFSKFVDHLIMGIIQILGMCLCGIGLYITLAIFFSGTMLIIDKGMSWGQAKDECMAKIKPEWLGWTIFTFVCMFVGGLCACITMPIGTCALAYAYDKTFGGGAKT